APYLHADIVLMGHLALLGKYLLVDERLYFRRMEVATSTALQKPEERLRHHYPAATARTLLQAWKLHLGWLHAGLSAPMPLRQRLRVIRLLVRRAIWDRGLLFEEVIGAFKYFLGLHGNRPSQAGA